jgi:hypothetical protein
VKERQLHVAKVEVEEKMKEVEEAKVEAEIVG